MWIVPSHRSDMWSRCYTLVTGSRLVAGYAVRPVILVLRWCGVLLYFLGAARMIVRMRRDAVRVLLYHACTAEEDDFSGGLSSNVTPGNFAAQLDFISTHYNVITVAELAAGSPSPRAIAITFDDGYRSVATNAAGLLQQRGLPFTVYLVTGVMDNSSLIWVNELNWLLRRNPAETVPLVAAACSASPTTPIPALIGLVRSDLEPRRIANLIEHVRTVCTTDTSGLAEREQLYLSWDEVLALRARGASFGSHTATHPSMPLLTEEETRIQINQAHDAIVERLGACDTFAFPFGDQDLVARELLLAKGYRSIMNVGGARTTFVAGGVPRVPAPDRGAAHLFAELEVVEPIKAWVRNIPWVAKSRTLP